MTAAPGEGRSSEWLADLEELADLAAETVAPQEVEEARRRRRGYSGERLASRLTVLPADEGAAAPSPGRRQAVTPTRPASSPTVLATGPGRIATAPPGSRGAPVPVWVPRAVVPLPHPGQAAVPAPNPGRAALPLPRAAEAGRLSPGRRRLLAPGLALLGAGALCAGLLLRLPGRGPAAPLGSGPAYSTPSPEAGGSSLRPALLEPASPEATLWPPLAKGAGAAPAATGSLPAAAAGGPAGAPPAASRTAAGPPARPSSGAAPVAVPAVTAGATPSPTAVPATAPASPPGAALAVRSVTLSMGTCEDRGAAWVCPETATFLLSPGAHGTLGFRIAGTAVTCSGASSAFDRPQPEVDVPAGTTQVTVTSALVFPAGSPPSAAAPGGASSTARVEVTSPNPVTSASESFGAASCP